MLIPEHQLSGSTFFHVCTTNQEFKPWSYTPPRSPVTTESITSYSEWKTSAQSSPDMLVWMWNFPVGKNVTGTNMLPQKAFISTKQHLPAKNQFAEKFLISLLEKLVDLISGSISQQWLRIGSLNCSGAPQLHSTYTHSEPQMCECSPAESSFLSWPAGLKLNYPLKILNFAVNFIWTSEN